LLNVQDGDGLLLSDVDVDPYQYQYLECELRTKSPLSNAVKASWYATDSMARGWHRQGCRQDLTTSTQLKELSSSWQKVRINLGHYWRWYASPKVTGLTIFPPPCASCEIRNIALLPNDLVCPGLKIDRAYGYNDPFMAVVESDKIPLKISTNQLPANSEIELDISKANFFFDNFGDNSQIDPVGDRVKVSRYDNAVPFSTTVGSAVFPVAGFYQIKARCLNSEGVQIGEDSDPITLQFGKRMF
jgi:hypothetical protein